MIIKPAQVSYWCHPLLILKYLNQVIIKHRSGGLHQMEKIRKRRKGQETRSQVTRNREQETRNKNQGVKKNGKKDISTSILLNDRSSDVLKNWSFYFIYSN